jgi:hypothetical protein
MVRLAADGLAGHLLWTYAHVRDEVRPVLQARGVPVSVPRLAGGPGRER